MFTLWRCVIEPLLRRWPGYPLDWELRRMLVFERASGRCESCGLPAGRIGLREGRWRVIRAHVHHVEPISFGGGHALSNLRLLCVQCHRAAHPDNASLGLPSKRNATVALPAHTQRTCDAD